MVHKHVRIELVVKQLRQNNPESKSVVFECPIGLTFEAGDWVDVDFADTSYLGVAPIKCPTVYGF